MNYRFRFVAPSRQGLYVAELVDRSDIAAGARLEKEDQVWCRGACLQNEPSEEDVTPDGQIKVAFVAWSSLQAPS